MSASCCKPVERGGKVAWRRLARLLLALAAFAVASPASADTDVVESIEQPPDPELAGLPPRPERVATPSPPPPAPSERYESAAWLGQRFELTRAANESAPSYLGVPHDRFLARSLLYGRFRYLRGRWLELTSSAHVAYGVAVREGPQRSGLAGRRVGDSFDPVLSELFVGLYSQRLDLRIGQQRVAWGRSDMPSPNDVVNARDRRDPVLGEREIVDQPTPLLRADWALQRWSLQGLWSPLFVPDRFDLWGSNWALIQQGAPPGIRGLFRQLATLNDDTLLTQFNRLAQQTRLPRPGLDAMSVGARLALAAAQFDFAAYYHYGFERTPLIRIEPAFASALAQTDFASTTAADFAPILAAIQAGAPPLTIEYLRRHHVGADAGTVLGPIGLRLDVGYDTRRVVLRRDLTGMSSRALEAVLSLEYQTGDVDKLLLAEVSALRLFDAGPASLLFVRPTTLTLAAVVRWPLLRDLSGELRVMGTIHPRSVVVRPELKWKAGQHLALRLGAVGLSGSTSGLAGYFERNSEVYANATYQF